MDNLVDETYFIRDINIPNTNDAKVLKELKSYIQKYQEECLIGLLGYSLYKVLSENAADERVLSILNGSEFTVGGQTHKWNGLVQPVQKISLIAYYVYYNYLYEKATQLTGFNVSIAKAEGAQTVSAQDKLMGAWNSFSRESHVLLYFLYNKNSATPKVYPEFMVSHYMKGREFSRRNNTFGI